MSDSILLGLVLASPWGALLFMIFWDVSFRGPSIARPVDEKPHYEKMLAVWTRILGASTIALVVATVLNAVVLSRTDDAIHRQLEVMQRDAEPIIVLGGDPMGPPWYSRQDGKVAWNLSYKNVGKGTAINLTHAKALVGVGPFDQQEGQGRPIFPSEGAFITLFSKPMSAADGETLLSREGGLKGFIRFDFQNAMGEKRSTSYCLVLQHNGAFQYRDNTDCLSELQRSAGEPHPR